jgi:YHS domain-containing protein
MLRFLIRLLGIVLILGLVRMLVQWVYLQFTQPRQPSSSQPTQPTYPASVETRRDPMCGAYVATTQSVKALVRGHEEHFCSSACRDKYLAA